MSKQGYLIKHDKTHGVQIAFVVLEDGVLHCYQDDTLQECMESFQLSGKKVTVKAQKRKDHFPNSFYIETRVVHVKNRSYSMGKRSVLELSALNSDERQAWGSAIFSWQRYYWRSHCSSPSQSVKNARTKQELENIVAQCQTSSTSVSSIRRALSKSLSFGNNGVQAA